MDVKRASREDMNPAGAAMARAFFDDPIYTWAFPDERTSLRRMIAMNKAMLPPMFKVPFMELYTTTTMLGSRSGQGRSSGRRRRGRCSRRRRACSARWASAVPKSS